MIAGMYSVMYVVNMQVRKSRGSSVWRDGFALRVALEPFRMRLRRLLPVQVGAHARDHVHAALLGGGAASPKKSRSPRYLPLRWNGTLVG